MQAFLVVTRDHTVLVDGCIGTGKRRARDAFHDLGGEWMERLQATGVRPEDVNHVVLTHLHVDHVGWVTRASADGGWEPVFPRARHLVASVELDYWTGDAGQAAMARTGDYVADSVEPLRAAGLLDLVALPIRLDAQLSILAASGHTPGNAVVRIEGAAATLFLVGDVIHHPLQLDHPRMSTRYCVDAERAAEQRVRILTAASEDDTVVVPSHFAGEGAFRLRQNHGGGFSMAKATDVIAEGPFNAATWRERRA